MNTLILHLCFTLFGCFCVGSASICFIFVVFFLCVTFALFFDLFVVTLQSFCYSAVVLCLPYFCGYFSCVLHSLWTFTFLHLFAVVFQPFCLSLLYFCGYFLPCIGFCLIFHLVVVILCVFVVVSPLGFCLIGPFSNLYISTFTSLKDRSTSSTTW